jgi:hypothetical protein
MLQIFLYELFSIYAEFVQMIFVAKNNNFFMTNSFMLSFYSQFYNCQNYLFLKYACFFFVFA